MTARSPRHSRMPDQLSVEDSTWVDLGHLRALVAEADRRDWPDSSLVSHGTGSEHPRRHDVHIARRVVVEGLDPEPTPSTTGGTP